MVTLLQPLRSENLRAMVDDCGTAELLGSELESPPAMKRAIGRARSLQTCGAKEEAMISISPYRVHWTVLFKDQNA